MSADRVEALLRRLKSIRDSAMRRAVLSRLLADSPPGASVELIAELVARSGDGRDAVALALGGLASALLDQESIAYSLRSDLYRCASATGSHDVARLFVQVSPVPNGIDLDEAMASSRVVVPRGRALTLGERKSLARGPRSELLMHLLRDPHPDVVHVLIDNPHLTEKDVLVMASLRPAVPDSLTSIFLCSRWSARYRIRHALALNPFSPLPLAVCLATMLRDDDLARLGRDGSVDEPRRQHAREVLHRRRRSRDRG